MTTPTREQVVQWAREAGLQLSINAEAYPSIASQLINFATLARADLEATIAERNKVKASYSYSFTNG